MKNNNEFVGGLICGAVISCLICFFVGLFIVFSAEKQGAIDHHLGKVVVMQTPDGVVRVFRNNKNK